MELALCGIVRTERLADPVFQIEGMLAKVEPKILANHYYIEYDAKYEDNEMQDDDNENQNNKTKKNQSLKEIETARLEYWQKWSDNYRLSKHLDQCNAECVCDAVGRK